MKQTLHFSRATSSLMAMIVSTVSFSIGLKYASDLSLPPQRAIFSSTESILCAIISILAVVYGIYRAIRPKILISYDENAIFIPEFGEDVPWSKVESLEAIKIKVGMLSSSPSNKPLVDDGIAIHFQESIQARVQKRPGTHARFISPNCFHFTCSVSYKGRDSILKEMNNLASEAPSL